MLVSDELNKRGRGRNPKYTARAQPVRLPRRGWHGLGPDAGTWRSPQVLSPTKAVDKVRALPERRKQVLPIQIQIQIESLHTRLDEIGEMTNAASLGLVCISICRALSSVAKGPSFGESPHIDIICRPAPSRRTGEARTPGEARTLLRSWPRPRVRNRSTT